jgi:phosphate/sulfate permease
MASAPQRNHYHLRSIALAWVLTLPAAVVLAAVLYYVFRSMV